MGLKSDREFKGRSKGSKVIGYLLPDFRVAFEGPHRLYSRACISQSCTAFAVRAMRRYKLKRIYKNDYRIT